MKAAQPDLRIWGSDSVIADEKLAALAPVQRCTQGQRWQWNGVDFEVLHPPPGDAWLNGRKARPNFGSCVLRIRSTSGRIALLAGDIESAQEQQLLLAGLAGPVDWLLVPHHGSKTSSTAPWVQTLRPRWAVVQAGYLNRFGHPVSAVVDRYRAVDSQVVLQDRCGAVHWSSSEPQSLQCERHIRAHYWDVHRTSTNWPW